MSDRELIDTIAAAIRDYPDSQIVRNCDCDNCYRDTAQAVLAAIREGHTILPQVEPDSTRYEGDEHEHRDRARWRVDSNWGVAVWDSNEIQIETWGNEWISNEPITPAEARAFAAALACAADQAERKQ